jgi:hypothetical protein
MRYLESNARNRHRVRIRSVLSTAELDQDRKWFVRFLQEHARRNLRIRAEMEHLRQLVQTNKRENKLIANKKKVRSGSNYRINSAMWKPEWGYGADFIEWQESKSEETAVVDLTVSSGCPGSSRGAMVSSSNSNVIDLVGSSVEKTSPGEETFSPFPKKREFSFED